MDYFPYLALDAETFNALASFFCEEQDISRKYRDVEAH